ncbi:hypothetical protein LTR08_003372 [Meristemomyces frigidus]|nr:hypothetical protein LTR08_003372 [Meristemomyces frigidus]
MLQGETHIVNDTIYSCHTSCELLNAGTWQSELETLVQWLEKNPYDVVTFLIVNSDFAQGTTVTNYTAAIEASGIRQYLYEPDYVPQHRSQWPTLGEMILAGQRVVMFMDYNANQTEVPYVLGLSKDLAEENYMYIANHNLNFNIDVSAIIGSGGSILIPNTAEMNVTNGDALQYGRLGAMSENCTGKSCALADTSRKTGYVY